VPITSLPKRALRPYEARIASPVSGVEKPSRTVANQIRTVARERIPSRLGTATAEEMHEVDLALAIQLGLPEPR
jgi:mRNA-degrading endonuclease toxin of MazEF toxin-antitoxin module